LRGTERYAFLFSLKPTDYKGWAKGLRKAGYATNPKYPEILIKNIEQYSLEQYTLIGEEASPKIEMEKSDNDSLSPDKSTKKNSQPSSWNTNDERSSVAEASTSINNRHKYIHAEKGTSLLAIASENNIDLSKLLAFNDLEEDGILKNDQIIFLQKKSKTGDKDFYIVQEQESTYEVAQKNGIQLKYFLAYNNLSENAIIPAGTKLFLNPTAAIQQATSAVQPTATSTAIAANKIHSVQPKEGLYTIAKSYKVSVQQLREWNKLTTDELKIGQQLIVSK
jgi:LysM repeat protein